MGKRPVANLLGLAVLGTLAQRPMHRYEIATTIREQGKDDDMDVKWGSLYTVVKNLERHGFVEAFQSPEVHQAIHQGMLGRIAVIYVEWSGAFDEQIILP